jgi:hypothetical protein
MDTKLRERLQELAGQMPVDPTMPTPVRRRVRFRRGTNATLAVTVIAALVAGGAIGIPAALRASGRTSGTVPAADGGDWRGRWPQATREEAEQAQACADSGDASCSWQLHPEETISRWAQAQFGAEAKVDFTVPPGLEDSDSPGPYTIQVSMAFRPSDFAVPVTIERLVRQDHTGIWSVTSPTLVEGSAIRGATDFATKFMQFRVKDISGAETFLSAEAKDAYDQHKGGLWLYSPDPDQHYYGFIIGTVAEGSAPQDFRIQVVIQEASPSTFTETLVVGPGTSSHGHDLPFVILSAARVNELPAGFTFSPIPSP